MSMGGATGKVVLTLVRLVASAVIAWLLVRMVKGGTRSSLVVSLALIFAGAVGNLVDSCFYGLIFNESYYSVATLFPADGGYAPLLQGKVVDMFYFPLFEFDWPTWLPLVGGNHFEFFNAIFNVADSAITVGIVWLMIDQFFIAPKYKRDGVVAQLVERRTENPCVTGSNPVDATTKRKETQVSLLCFCRYITTSLRTVLSPTRTM